MRLNKITKALLDERSVLEKQVNALNEDLKAIDRLLGKYRHKDTTDHKKPVKQESLFTSNKKRGVIAGAVRSILSSNPTKLWTALEVRDELQKLVNEGKVTSGAKSILNATHTVLRAFVKNKTVEKVYKEGETDPYYKKVA